MDQDDDLKKPPKQSSGSRRADRGVCSPTAVFLLFLLAVSVAVIWGRQTELNSAVERSRHLAQKVQDMLKLDGSKSKLVSALEAEIRQLKEKMSLLDTQYNECSEQLTACRQDPLVETMRSKVDRLEQQNELLSRDLGECNGKLLALKTELDDWKHRHHGRHHRGRRRCRHRH